MVEIVSTFMSIQTFNGFSGIEQSNQPLFYPIYTNSKFFGENAEIVLDALYSVQRNSSKQTHTRIKISFQTPL